MKLIISRAILNISRNRTYREKVRAEKQKKSDIVGLLLKKLTYTTLTAFIVKLFKCKNGKRKF